jgi:S1-C subfamily serine protease
MNISKYLATLLIAPTLTFAQASFAQDSEPDSNRRLTMYTKPSIVRIISKCEGTFKFKDKAYNPQGESQDYAPKYSLNFVGTGFLINPNGYIVTSSKVAESSKDCEDYLARNVVQGLKDFYGHDDDDNSINTGNYDDYGEFTSKKFGGSLKQDGGRQFPGEYDVYFPYSENNAQENNTKLIEVKFSGRKTGQTVQINKDVAIIKVSLTNAPVLKLADASQVQIQDRIIAVGYPNAADLDQGVQYTEKSYLEASVQEGRVSNPNKEIDGGYPVLQIDIRAAEGSAGSPLINDQGEVVGMLVFNDSDKDSFDDNGQGVPVAIPTSTIQEFIRQSGATNQLGEADLLYKEGLQNYWQGNYKEAKANFLQVRNLYPFHSEVPRLISEIEQIEAERWAKPWTNPTYIFTAGLILTAGAVGGIALYLLKQKSNLATANVGNRGAATGGNSVFTSSFTSNGRNKKCSIEMEYQGQIQRFQLHQDEHHLGRDPSWSDFDIPTSWEVISRQHATLKKEGADYRIFDGDGKIPSRNGLWVNDDYRVDPQEGYLLNNGDRLKIGQDAREQILLTYYNPTSGQANVGTTMVN